MKTRLRILSYSRDANHDVQSLPSIEVPTIPVNLAAPPAETVLNHPLCMLQLGYKPKFHVLDVTVPESVQKLRDHIVQSYNGLDVLVNNAGIEIKVRSRFILQNAG